jgi:hypothetical protein
MPLTRCAARACRPSERYAAWVECPARRGAVSSRTTVSPVLCCVTCTRCARCVCANREAANQSDVFECHHVSYPALCERFGVQTCESPLCRHHLQPAWQRVTCLRSRARPLSHREWKAYRRPCRWRRTLCVPPPAVVQAAAHQVVAHGGQRKRPTLEGDHIGRGKPSLLVSHELGRWVVVTWAERGLVGTGSDVVRGRHVVRRCRRVGVRARRREQALLSRTVEGVVRRRALRRTWSGWRRARWRCWWARHCALAGA